LHQHSSRPGSPTSLHTAIMHYLDTTMGPVLPNSSEQHARKLIADQAAKKLAKDPWFQQQMASSTVGGLFDFVAKAVGSVGKAVGAAVRDVAPVVATIAPALGPVGMAIGGAAAMAGAVANKLVPKDGGAQDAGPAAVPAAYAPPSARPAFGTFSAARP